MLELFPTFRVKFYNPRVRPGCRVKTFTAALMSFTNSIKDVNEITEYDDWHVSQYHDLAIFVAIVDTISACVLQLFWNVVNRSKRFFLLIFYKFMSSRVCLTLDMRPTSTEYEIRFFVCFVVRVRSESDCVLTHYSELQKKKQFRFISCRQRA